MKNKNNEVEQIQSTSFRKELTALINRYSKENESDTPDFILADYLIGCLNNFNGIMVHRKQWYNNREV